jgi:hypothetical protein
MIFGIIWLSIPIWVILFVTKSKRGYFWYSRKLFNNFWNYFISFETLKLARVSVYHSYPTGLAFFDANFFINKLGIYMRRSRSLTKKSGTLIFFDKENTKRLMPPSYAVYKSHKIIEGNLVIKAYSIKNVIDSSFKIKLKSLNKEQLEKLDTLITEHSLY